MPNANDFSIISICFMNQQLEIKTHTAGSFAIDGSIIKAIRMASQARRVRQVPIETEEGMFLALFSAYVATDTIRDTENWIIFDTFNQYLVVAGQIWLIPIERNKRILLSSREASELIQSLKRNISRSAQEASMENEEKPLAFSQIMYEPVTEDDFMPLLTPSKKLMQNLWHIVKAFSEAERAKETAQKATLLLPAYYESNNSLPFATLRKYSNIRKIKNTYSKKDIYRIFSNAVRALAIMNSAYSRMAVQIGCVKIPRDLCKFTDSNNWETMVRRAAETGDDKTRACATMFLHHIEQAESFLSTSIRAFELASSFMKLDYPSIPEVDRLITAPVDDDESTDQIIEQMDKALDSVEEIAPDIVLPEQLAIAFKQ